MQQPGRAATPAKGCRSSASEAIGQVHAEAVHQGLGEVQVAALWQHISARASLQADSRGGLTSDGRALGCCSRYMATTPATCGAAMLVPEPQVYEVSLTCRRPQHHPSSDHCGLKSVWGWVEPVSSTSSVIDGSNGPVCTGMSHHMQHRHPHLQM